MKKYIASGVGLLAFPAVALAQSLTSVLGSIKSVIDTATPIVVALALLYFFWGLAKYILNSADEEEKEKGRNIMIWGIIALFVMLSVFGIVDILQNTFSIKGGGDLGGSQIPSVGDRD